MPAVKNTGIIAFGAGRIGSKLDGLKAMVMQLSYQNRDAALRQHGADMPNQRQQMHARRDLKFLRNIQERACRKFPLFTISRTFNFSLRTRVRDVPLLIVIAHTF